MAIYNPREAQQAAGRDAERPDEDQSLPMEHDGRQSPSLIFNPFYTGRPRTPVNGRSHTPVDRNELIKRIKSRDSRPSSPELGRVSGGQSRKWRSPSPERPRTPEKLHDNEAIGMQIERPRSALHRGDFREKDDAGLAFERFGQQRNEGLAPSLSTSPVAPWRPDFPAAVFRQSRPQRNRLTSPPRPPADATARPRAISQATLAASFSYQPPTSPLVQSSRPETPEPITRHTSRSPDKSRRHTFSPPSFKHAQTSIEYPASARSLGGNKQTIRAGRTFPYQAHQPRRSVHSFQSLPHTPVPRSRRPSLAEAGLQHAPMVGSYEESILRGRMSTTPSKPLNFVAQIGVLGKGDCQPKLRCPPHVTVPFPAVFYSYASTSTMTDQPSPYVGMVDLQNTLPGADISAEKRRQQLNRVLSAENSRSSSRTREEGSAPDVKARRRQRAKLKRRSGSPRAPPGGSYRIPQQGQLQIIIKNPNKTAVKLFLVPYDLSDMEPGQKTFIRQRSYSAGPIIDMPLTSRKNLGTDRPEASLNTSDDPNERPTLRYLVHLHICCPAKGRYFLYKSIRVVFANRVPDGKEKLRNETQLPEPRYSTYKPTRDSNAVNTSSAIPKAAAETVDDHNRFHTHETWSRPRYHIAQSLPAMEYGHNMSQPMQPLPFHIETLSPLDSRPASRSQMSPMSTDNDSQWSESTTLSPGSRMAESAQLASIRKLDEPFSFERDRSRERQPGARSESLLSRRLKDLAFQVQREEV
ncbi:hypothetical protein LTR86_009140 [Recurvomyces mirabilis]|nr:hypothetical protein LTR86_009140 [Recurvomyces mirabilis]